MKIRWTRVTVRLDEISTKRSFVFDLHKFSSVSENGPENSILSFAYPDE